MYQIKSSTPRDENVKLYGAGLRSATSLLVLMATLAAFPALAKGGGKPPPPPPPPCAQVSGPVDFVCGAVTGVHIFLDKGKSVTSTTAEYPKANVADNVAVTLNTAADVAEGFANINPEKGGPLLTDITFRFTNPNNAVTGFLFRGQLNETKDPIVVTITDQNNAKEVFDYNISSGDIGALGFSQAIVGARVAIVSLFTKGGWSEGKQYEVTECTAQSCPNGGFGGGGGVPEPASWALMLIGAGSVGAIMRRRRGLLLA